MEIFNPLRSIFIENMKAALLLLILGIIVISGCTTPAEPTNPSNYQPDNTPREKNLTEKIADLPSVKNALAENPSTEVRIQSLEGVPMQTLKTGCPEVQEGGSYSMISLIQQIQGEGWTGSNSIGSFVVDNNDLNHQYCKSGAFVEVDLGSQVPECISVLQGSSSGEKINFVFLSDNYPDNQDSVFAQQVIQTIDQNGASGGILAVEPFKSYKDSFNFYRVKLNRKLNCLGTGDVSGSECLPWAERLMSACNKPTIGIVMVADQISGIGLVISGGSKTGDTRYGTLRGENIVRTDGYYKVLPDVTVHELGHIFGLADEYQAITSLTETGSKENCDTIGCSEWCSGQINTDSPCYANYTGFINCVKQKAGFETGTFSMDVYIECMGQFIVESESESCNLGVDCQQGTGCYPNCHGWGLFRSTNEGIMSNQELHSFGAVGEKIICEKLRELTHEVKGICSTLLA